MSLHAEPLIWTLRLYDGPGGYDQRAPYVAVVTISMLGNKRAWISSLHGKFTRARWREIHDWLASRGVESVVMERRGKYVEVRCTA